MKVLCDTHAILWWLGADPRLSDAARAAIARAGSNALVSAASIWEASIKRSAGKLSGPDLGTAVQTAGLSFLRIDERHAKLAGELPLLHRDPFDRMLVAQATLEDVPIVTADPDVAKYAVRVVW